ncbi:MAG: GntR family transcriptional regulator [Actinobacteria bacterium]|nr:GntR family transcriptional regulator [Actinomycetota bacterium]OJU83648.1 MAG: hypothetical protein BGO11_12275 [Solirubrobacterales bacterium 70-9]
MPPKSTATDKSLSGGPAPLTPVSTVEALERELRRRILDGELAPGTHLRETDLADSYRVGRYTVRSAFQRLVHSGMAVYEQNRGVSVLQPTPEVIRDVYSFRAAIEAESARRIIERELSLDRVHAAVERLQKLPKNASRATLIQADLAVHQAIVEAAESPRMLTAFLDVVDQVMLFLSAASLERLEVVLTHAKHDHGEIADALESGDQERAVALIRRHLYGMLDEQSGD